MTAASRHSIVCLLAFFLIIKKLKIIIRTIKNVKNEARSLKRTCQPLLNFQGASDFPLGCLIFC